LSGEKKGAYEVYGGVNRRAFQKGGITGNRKESPNLRYKDRRKMGKRRERHKRAGIYKIRTYRPAPWSKTLVGKKRRWDGVHLVKREKNKTRQKEEGLEVGQ